VCHNYLHTRAEGGHTGSKRGKFHNSAVGPRDLLYKSKLFRILSGKTVRPFPQPAHQDRNQLPPHIYSNTLRISSHKTCVLRHSSLQWYRSLVCLPLSQTRTLPRRQTLLKRGRARSAYSSGAIGMTAAKLAWRRIDVDFLEASYVEKKYQRSGSTISCPFSQLESVVLLEMGASISMHPLKSSAL